MDNLSAHKRASITTMIESVLKLFVDRHIILILTPLNYGGISLKLFYEAFLQLQQKWLIL